MLKGIRIHLFNCLFSGHLIQKAGSTNLGFLFPYHYPFKTRLTSVMEPEREKLMAKRDEMKRKANIPHFFCIKDQTKFEIRIMSGKRHIINSNLF